MTALETVPACPECGKPFQRRSPVKRFCSRVCSVAFNNRRMQRGLELYDFVMSKRFDRKHEADARGIIDSLAGGYREQDIRAREGRRSWQPFEVAVNGLDRLPGVADGR